MDEVASLKLPELKKECKARGLPITGNKSELVARLTAAMATEKPPSDDSVLDDALIDEDSMLDEDSSGAGSSNEESSNVLDLNSPTSTVPPTAVLKGSPEKKGEAIKRPASTTTSPVKSQTNGSSAATVDDGSPPKKKIVINREPLPTPAPTLPTSDSVEAEDDKDKKVIKISALTAEEKLKLRQAKFGASAAAASEDVVAKVTSPASAASVAANPFLDERKKKRAERFGATTTSPAAPASTGKISLTTEEDVRIAKRKERFGASEIIAEDKKTKRADRFGSTPAGNSTTSSASVKVTPAEVDEKKKQRAARFAGAP